MAPRYATIFGWLLFSCVGLWLRPAQAEPARLEYAAPPACPNQEAFTLRVRERGGDFDAASGDVTRVEVALREETGGFVGSVRIESAGTSSTPREVKAARCDEVADGLAVVVAIALQKNAPAPASATLTPASEAASVVAPPPPPPPPAPKPKSEPRRLRTIGQWGDQTLKVKEGELGVRADGAVTLSGGAAFGLLPGTIVPRFDLSVSRTNFITTPDDAGFIVGGILRARWSVFAPITYRADNGESASMFAFKAGIGGCSQVSYDRQGLVLLLCGEIAAGVGHASTTDALGVTTDSEEVQGIGTAGFDFDARYNLSSLFHLAVGVGGEVWVASIVASRPDGSEMVKTNPVSAYANLGLGIHF